MPRPCSVCRRTDRGSIEAALLGGESLRNIAERFGTSPPTLLRHREHVSTSLACAKARREEDLGDELATELGEIRRAAWAAKDLAEKTGDVRAVLGALKLLLEHAEVAARAAETSAGELAFLKTPTWRQIKEDVCRVVLEEVGPEGCRRVGERFARLAQESSITNSASRTPGVR
jgi:hypothetical protein